jgi:hypothetical protein
VEERFWSCVAGSTLAAAFITLGMYSIRPVKHVVGVQAATGLRKGLLAI